MVNQKVVKQMDKDFEALIKHLSQDKMEELLKKYALEDGNEESMTPLKRILSAT